MGAALIGIDWGTSNFRAFLLDRGGAILARRAGPHGILAVADGDFAAVLRREVGPWLDAAPVPVLMSGMIGSRQGWREAAYATAPAGIGDLAAALVAVPFGAAAHIVPGVEAATPMMRDVMRGEETQIFGALAQSGEAGGRFLLPGTHSKWASVEAGRIVGFSTYMTGEIYAAARNHTILGRLMQAGGEDQGIFLRGVRDGARAGGPGALLNRLFGVRTAGLFGDIAAAALSDYLSGLLIGAEIADAASADARPAGAAEAASARRRPVGIVAADALAARYRAAAAELGVASTLLSPDCVVHGYLAIAAMAGLLPAG